MADALPAQLPEEVARSLKRPMEEPADAATSPPRPGSRQRMPETVNDVVHGAVMCKGTDTLNDAADLLILHDRTAAAVVDDDGALLGVITENDIVHAYWMEESRYCIVDDWLQKTAARLPRHVVPSLTVKPTDALSDAAAIMREHADGATAFRHLVVRDEGGGLKGILSALDLTRALCLGCSDEDVAERVSKESVSEVMKPTGALPTAGSGATLRQVLEQMDASRQNCVLVAEPDQHPAGPVGIVTPRDAVRAFTERVRAGTTVGHYLRGLQSKWEQRIIHLDVQLRECAAKMAYDSVHHLVVLSPDTGDMAGVVSSTDMARSIGVTDTETEAEDMAQSIGAAETEVSDLGEPPMGS